MAQAKPEPLPGDEHLSRDEHKALALIRDSMGQQAFEQHRLMLLREHAKRIIKYTPEDVNVALAYLDGTGTLRKGVGPLHKLARKYVMEDKTILQSFTYFVRQLKDAPPPKINDIAWPPKKAESTRSNKKKRKR